MQGFFKTVVVPSLLSIGLLLPMSHADEHWTSSARIDVKGKSSSAGAINLNIAFEPAEDGTTADPVAVEVLVSEKVKDKDVTDLIANDVSALLGSDNYSVDNGIKRVTIKAKRGSPDMFVELANNSVQGISVEISN